MRGNPLKYTDPSGHATPPIKCYHCNRKWFSYDNLPAKIDLAVDLLVQAGCIFASCHVDADNNVVSGPTEQEWIEGNIAGLGNPLGTVVTTTGSRVLSRSVSYLRHTDAASFQALLKLGRNSVAGIDNILAGAGPDSIIRGFTDKMGNQIALTAGNRNKGLRHVVGRHLTGTIPGGLTTFFPSWAKVGDITDAVGDVISNGARHLDDDTGNWVYTHANDAFGTMKVIVDDIGEIISAYPVE